MDAKKTGTLISTARKKKGLTQKELAEKLHISDRAVSRWERGVGFPDVSLLSPLADALGLSVAELIQGSRERPADPELSIREAIDTVYRQMQRKLRKNLGAITIAAILLVMAVLGVRWGLEKIGETRILFPPELSSEILLDNEEVGAELLVKKSNTGVYKYVCRYEVNKYGRVTLRAKNDWQSYEDVVTKEEYDSLCALSPKQLVEVSRLQQGFLAVYTDNSSYTILETEGLDRVVFTYEKPDSTDFSGASVSETQLCILAYDGEHELLVVTVVDKATGTEEMFSLSCADLNGSTESNLHIGNFLWDPYRFCLADNVLYYAQTNYYKGSVAVIGAYDLQRGEALSYREIEGAEVVNAYWNEDSVRVLVNRKHYTPPELYTFALDGFEETDMVTLELPHEYLSGKDGKYSAGYFDRGAMTSDRVLLVLGDHGAALGDEENRTLLVVYDAATGEQLSRTRLHIESGYEIFEVRLPSDKDA